MIAGWMVLIALIGVPPLTDAQSAQLSTAVDDSARLDEGALYPLLHNALTWEAGDTTGGEVGDHTGGRVPDYDALLADPKSQRGELFLIKGRFAGRARRFDLARSGAWGEALTEWVLLISDDPQEVAVVYFVDPDGTMNAPKPGTRVRAVGRFYKVWADTDQQGNPTRYLTFVARNASVVPTQARRPVIFMLPTLGVILTLSVVFILLRRAGRAAQNRDRGVHHGPGTRDDAMLSGSVDPSPGERLPDDPAEALRRMAQRRD
jgi:hypothetical protein